MKNENFETMKNEDLKEEDQETKKKLKVDPRIKPKTYKEFKNRFKIFKMSDMKNPVADLANKDEEGNSTDY